MHTPTAFSANIFMRDTLEKTQRSWSEEEEEEEIFSMLNIRMSRTPGVEEVMQPSRVAP
jgi:flagellar biosynthesis chaperone FliJ